MVFLNAAVPLLMSVAGLGGELGGNAISWLHFPPSGIHFGDENITHLALALAFGARAAKTRAEEDRTMLDLTATRRRMVDNQIRTADVTHRPLLAALDELPREGFLPEPVKPFAYSDRHLEVGRIEATGELRYALAPVLIARMLQAIEPVQGSKVLHVACGTGYASAILAKLGAHVVALDEDAGLIGLAEAALAAAGISGVKLVTGPLAAGAPGEAPFDVIFIEGAYRKQSGALIAQLAEEGRLIGVEGTGRAGQVMLQVKSHGTMAGRAVFDASAPLLAPFAGEPEFAF
jgi:protein-L-isoaspartate(D-aspartate) O-methyltransferase